MSAESTEHPLSLLVRIPIYLLVVLLSAIVMAVGTFVMALPTIAPAVYASHGGMVPYLIALSITGFVITATQLIAKGDWVPDDFDPEEHPLSKLQMVAISAAWYNLLVLSAIGLGLLAVSMGYAFVAPFVALFVGPVDVLLAKRLGVSPLSLLVAGAVLCLQLGLRIGRDGGESPVVFSSSELVYVATGQGFKRRKGEEFFDRQNESKLL